jgi:hypothetical protein
MNIPTEVKAGQYFVTFNFGASCIVDGATGEVLFLHDEDGLEDGEGFVIEEVCNEATGEEQPWCFLVNNKFFVDKMVAEGTWYCVVSGNGTDGNITGIYKGGMI